MNVEVLRYRQRLDYLFSKAADLNDEPEIQSHWARYLCILVSGYVETSLRHLLVSYSQTKSHPRVTSFVSSRFRRPRNFSMEEILTLVGSFDPDWRKELEAGLGDEVKDAISGLLTNRNNIAHGRDVGISMSTIKSYYRNASKLLDKLETLCSS